MPMKLGTSSDALESIRRLWEGGPTGSQSDTRLLARYLEGTGEVAELAFAALVERHGSTVRRACFAVLGDPHDADDASQATFLVLARRAGSIRAPESLGPWLVRVARRVARKALVAADRRRRVERRSAERRPSDASSPPPSPPEPSVLEELARLPEKYRAAVATVDLRGRTQAEAAEELGWPLGTLQTRLHRGRLRLRSRLARLGLGPAAVTAAIAAEAARASAISTALPRGWAASTAHAAVRFAGRGAAVPLATARLAEGVVAALEFGRRAAILSGVGLLAVVAGLGVVLSIEGGRPNSPPELVPTSAPIPPARLAASPIIDQDPEDGGGPVVRGKVVDEDGDPVAGAVVRIDAAMWTPPDASTDADGTFAVNLRSDIPPRIEPDIHALADGGRLQAEVDSVAWGTAPTLVLKPARTIVAKVVDADGGPVAGATVSAEAYSYLPKALAETDENGEARLLVPPGIEIIYVAALKPGAGFDYFENFETWPTPEAETYEAPEAVTLTLEGARTVRVSVRDPEGRPVPGVRVHPKSIKKREKLSRMTPSLPERIVISDEDGVATFDWLPRDLSNPVGFDAWPEPYSQIGEAWYDPLRADDPVVVTVVGNGSITGRVLDAEGRPVSGAGVTAEGYAPAAPDRADAYDRTASDGTYKLVVESDHIYMISAQADGAAAPARSGIHVGEGEHVADLDFRLEAGVRVRGRVTVGPEHEPAAGRTVLALERGPMPREPSPFSQTPINGPELTHWARTDAEGRYEFLAARGARYVIVPLFGARSGNPATIAVTPDDPAEIVQDFDLPDVPAEPPGPIAGRVLDPDGRPVPDAIVQVATIDSSEANGTARVDTEGRFQVQPRDRPTQLASRSPDGRLAVALEVGAGESEVVLDLAPAATIRGRVIGPDGLPAPRALIGCSWGLHPSEDGRNQGPFWENYRTDAEGRYMIPGMPVGTHALVSISQVDRIAQLQLFEVDSPDLIERPDLVLTAPPLDQLPPEGR